MTPKMMMGDVLDTYPDTEEVLLDYGIPLDEVDLEQTLGQLCRAEGLDVHEIMAEIVALSDGELDDDWDDEIEQSWLPVRDRRMAWN